MKLTKSKLKQIIKEELHNMLYEQESSDPAKRANVEKDSEERWKVKEAAAKEKCKGKWKPGKYTDIEDNKVGSCENPRRFKKETPLEESKLKQLIKEALATLKEQGRSGGKKSELQKKLDLVARSFGVVLKSTPQATKSAMTIFGILTKNIIKFEQAGEPDAEMLAAIYRDINRLKTVIVLPISTLKNNLDELEDVLRNLVDDAYDQPGHSDPDSDYDVREKGVESGP